MTDQLTLAASILPLSTLDSRLSTFCPNSFRLIHFRKNASVTPLVSHTFKTKDLKPFRFIHFQKKVGGTPSIGRTHGTRITSHERWEPAPTWSGRVPTPVGTGDHWVYSRGLRQNDDTYHWAPVSSHRRFLAVLTDYGSRATNPPFSVLLGVLCGKTLSHAWGLRARAPGHRYPA